MVVETGELSPKVKRVNRFIFWRTTVKSRSDTKDFYGSPRGKFIKETAGVFYVQ